jgi:uncharacterized protein
MKDYNFVVQPTPGAIISVKGYATGEFEGYYGSDVAFYELANDIARFKGFKPNMKREPVQSFWTFTVEVGLGVRAADRGKFTSWGDLNGQRVFTGPRPWDTRAQIERVLATLGVKHEYTEASTSTAGSLLDSGRYVGLGVYTNAEATTAPWITEASIQADWAILNPSSAEVAKAKAAGIASVQVPTSAFGKSQTFSPNATLFPFYYGLHVGMDMPADDLFRMLNIIESKTADLAASNKAFSQVDRDFVGMQKRGLDAAVNLVKVHPGLAKYMQSKGAWDSAWNSRVASN